MIINDICVNDFEVIHASVCFFWKFYKFNQYLLYGPKLKGFGEGYLMPPGGKRKDEDDKNPVLTARREGKEETNLTGLSNMICAELTVIILEKKQKLQISIVLFTHWEEKDSELKWNNEFENLEFIPLYELLKANILPKDAIWMREVFLNSIPVNVELVCGTSRDDVLSFIMKPR